MRLPKAQARQQHIALIGLEATLTAGIACAELAGQSRLSDQLLMMKRDALKIRQQLEAEFEQGIAA
jgi:hypothetical protein